MVNAKFLDLQAAYHELRYEIEAAVSRVLGSGRYIGGAEVESFEDEFASYCDVDYCIGVANGLDALELSLKVLGIGPGDEVVVPSNTFIATWMAVTNVGATVVPVEPDFNTFNIEINRITAAVTPRTKAIIPVHLYGQPCDLDPILELAKRLGVYVIEDAAQSHGARYKGRRIGGHGDLVAWSFYPGKNLGAIGDAGAITTRSESLACELRKLRNYGSSQRYLHESKGYNSRIDPIQASILNVKLKYLDDWNSRRTEIANYYLNNIKNPLVTLPKVCEWCDPVWHLFVIQHPERNSLQNTLISQGIETLIHYPIPPHQQGAYKNEFLNYKAPLTEKIAEFLLSLPMGPHLSIEQACRVSSCINMRC